MAILRLGRPIDRRLRTSALVELTRSPRHRRMAAIWDIVEEVRGNRVSMPLSGGSGSSGGPLSAARGGRRYAPIAASSPPVGLKRARRLRFWAVAARRNSSLAPFGPLRRRRASRRIRLRWANSISTFFRRRQAASYSGVGARARATSRASSCRSRGILPATAFGQHCALSRRRRIKIVAR